MTSFEKVNKVWCDLEEAYVKRNNGLSRMDFLKKILMYDSGEAAIRNLVKKVSDDRFIGYSAIHCILKEE